MIALAWLPIPLSQNLYALVDGENYKQLSVNKWYVNKLGNTYYAMRGIKQNDEKQLILMHREILGLQYKDNIKIDHQNGNGLDNRKCNLRIATNQQNQFNQSPRKNVLSRFKGVGWHKHNKKWQAVIWYNGKCIHLGYFDDEVEAAKLYNQNAIKLFGEFAHLNEINNVSEEKP